MYKKTIIVVSVLLMSGCAEIVDTLATSAKKGWDKGIAGKTVKSSKVKNENLTKDEKKWNSCITKKREFIKKGSTHMYLTDSDIEKSAVELCFKDNPRLYSRVETLRRKRLPNRENRINECITRNTSNLKTEVLRPKIVTMCKESIDYDPYNQCVLEKKFKDIDDGRSIDTYEAIDKRCSHLLHL